MSGGDGVPTEQVLQQSSVYIERDRQTDTDRETDGHRQRDRQTDRLADWNRAAETDRQYRETAKEKPGDKRNTIGIIA